MAKMSVSVHAQGVKTIHVGGKGSKNGKILSTLNAPYHNFLTMKYQSRFICLQT